MPKMSSSRWYRVTAHVLFAVLQTAAAAQNLCDTCNCEVNVPQIQIQTVQCSRLHLKAIPPSKEWPPRTDRLDLSHNDISTIPKLDSSELSHLELQYNKINNIEVGAFIGVRNLLYLSLSFNAFREIRGLVFRGLEFLLTFNLNSNYISHIDSNSFYDFRDLEELNLRENPLKHLDPKLFQKLLFLKKLDLSHTQIYALDNGFFKDMKSLVSLDLSHNDFSEVPSIALRSAEKLSELKLTDNPIIELTEKSFYNLATLEVLELNYMEKLRQVGQATFSALEKLRILRMSGNKRLTNIQETAFVGHENSVPSALQEVDISSNNLAEVSETMLPCQTIGMYNLQGNPWKCDCRMRWIVNCSIPAYLQTSLGCSSPFALRKVPMKSLKAEDFQCPSYNDTSQNHSKALKISLFIAALLLAFMIGVFIALLARKGHIKYFRCCMKHKGIGSVYYVQTRTEDP